MANAIPVGKGGSKVEQPKVEIIELEGKKLPEDFEIPAKASKVVIDGRGTIRVDLGF
jgi:hypothetical protein